jgi:hypothetical protein
MKIAAGFVASLLFFFLVIFLSNVTELFSENKYKISQFAFYNEYVVLIDPMQTQYRLAYYLIMSFHIGGLRIIFCGLWEYFLMFYPCRRLQLR